MSRAEDHQPYLTNALSSTNRISQTCSAPPTVSYKCAQLHQPYLKNVLSFTNRVLQMCSAPPTSSVLGSTNVLCLLYRRLPCMLTDACRAQLHQRLPCMLTDPCRAQLYQRLPCMLHRHLPCMLHHRLPCTRSSLERCWVYGKAAEWE
jgi:hypothetical protein